MNFCFCLNGIYFICGCDFFCFYWVLGAACHGFASFRYSVFAAGFNDVVVEEVQCG